MKKRTKIILGALGVFLACLCIAMVCVFHWAFTESYDYEKRSEYVEMSDGTKIAVDIYMPEDYDGEACPVIFQYTPYGRAYIVGEEQNLFEKIAYKYAVGTSSGILDRANSKDTVYGSTAEMVNMFLENGYIYVCADMRGTGASYGHKIDFSPDIATDGAQMIDWMAQQSWCDGNVGMFGGSYLGYSQLVVAGQQPEALKCIIPEVVPLDGYTGEIRPGGVFLWSYSQQDMQIYLEYNCYMPDDWIYPTTPVVDEDGDGDLLDEIPLDLDGDGNFLNDYNYTEDPNDEPQYADGNKREHIYYLATYDHLQNIPYSELGPNTEYIDSDWSYEGETMNSYDVSPSASLQAIKDSGIAVCLHGGWMDPFVRGTTELYNTLKDTNPTYMIIGPDYHMGTSPFWEYCGSSEEEELTAYGEKWLRFFDFYLKGIDNGLDEEDPIQIYVMNGGGWRQETEWPLSDSEGTAYYLNANGTLTTDQGADGKDNYTVDFTHSSVWDNEGWSANRWLMEPPRHFAIPHGNGRKMPDLHFCRPDKRYGGDRPSYHGSAGILDSQYRRFLCVSGRCGRGRKCHLGDRGRAECKIP